jgi:hypothetical protein
MINIAGGVIRIQAIALQYCLPEGRPFGAQRSGLRHFELRVALHLVWLYARARLPHCTTTHREARWRTRGTVQLRLCLLVLPFVHLYLRIEIANDAFVGIPGGLQFVVPHRQVVGFDQYTFMVRPELLYQLLRYAMHDS